MRHRIVVENPAILYDYPKRLRALRFASRSFLSVAAVSILSGFVGCTVTILQSPYVKPAPLRRSISSPAASTRNWGCMQRRWADL